MRPFLLLFAALLISSTSGCKLLKRGNDDDSEAPSKREPPKPKPDAPAPEVEWGKFGGKLEFKDTIKGEKASVRVDFSPKEPGHLQLTSAKLPSGTKLEVGDNKFEVASGSSSYQSFTADFRAALGQLDFALFDKPYPKHDFGLKLKVNVPGYKPLETAVPELALAGGVDRLLSSVTQGPLLFPGEAPVAQDAKAKAALLVAENGGVKAAVGTAKTLAEVDWIAVMVNKPSSKMKTCGGYTSGSVILKLVDSEVTVYERRSGSPVDGKAFKASGVCPTTVYVGPDRTTSSYASVKSVKNWLTFKLTGRNPAVPPPSFGQMLR